MTDWKIRINRFTEDAWFWPYLKLVSGYYTVEVYGRAPAQLCSK